MSNIHKMKEKTVRTNKNHHPVIFTHLIQRRNGVLRTIFLVAVPIATGMASHHSNFTFSPKCVPGASVNIK